MVNECWSGTIIEHRGSVHDDYDETKMLVERVVRAWSRHIQPFVSDINLVLSNACLVTKCNGDNGDKGDKPNPAWSELRTSLMEYCAVNGLSSWERLLSRL